MQLWARSYTFHRDRVTRHDDKSLLLPFLPKPLVENTEGGSRQNLLTTKTSEKKTWLSDTFQWPWYAKISTSWQPIDPRETIKYIPYSQWFSVICLLESACPSVWHNFVPPFNLYQTWYMCTLTNAMKVFQEEGFKILTYPGVLHFV
jgi:hypothetical protein